MKYLWRRFYNLNTDGGGGGDTLDSPGATTSVSADMDNDDPIPATPINAASNGDVTNPKDNAAINNPNATPPADPPKEEEKEEEEQEKDIYAQADELLGYGIAGEPLPEGIDGLAEFGKRSYTKGAEEAVQREWQELERSAAPAVDLARWLQSGRTEMEFYLSRMEQPRIEPDSLETADDATVRDIVKKNFLRSGLDEEQAEAYTQMSSDANRLRIDAKKIVATNNAREDATRAEQAQAEAAKAEADRKAFDKMIEERIATVKTGKLGAITIPQVNVDSFIKANYYNANNPEYPNMSEVDIKMAMLDADKMDALRYLVHIDFDFNKLVQNRKQTVDVAKAILGAKAGASKMSGGGNRVEQSDDRTLDSPGT